MDTRAENIERLYHHESMNIKRLYHHESMKKALAEWAKAYAKANPKYKKPRDEKLYELCVTLGLDRT